MSGPEIHPAVEAENVQARHEDDAIYEEAQKSVERIIARLEAEEKAQRRKVNVSIICKALITICIVTGLELALRFGLMAWVLALPLEVGALCWFSVYVGAWLQFHFGKEGLLK